MEIKHRRRWLRYSLRTGLILVTLLCIWLAVLTKRARDQKEAVAALRALGCTIGYEHQLIGFDYRVGIPGEFADELTELHEICDTMRPAELSEIEQWIGEDYFLKAIEVANYNGDGEDAVEFEKLFPNLQRLPHLRRFSFPSLTCAEIQQLSTLQGLTHLSFAHRWVDDDDLDPISKLTHLQSLIVSNFDCPKRPSGECLKPFQKLHELWQLDIEADCSMKSLDYLASLEQLEILASLHLTDVDESLLPRLQRFKNLNDLHLTGDVREHGWLRNLFSNDSRTRAAELEDLIRSGISADVCFVSLSSQHE